jgi:hypothetical protein
MVVPGQMLSQVVNTEALGSAALEAVEGYGRLFSGMVRVWLGLERSCDTIVLRWVKRQAAQSQFPC